MVSPLYLSSNIFILFCSSLLFCFLCIPNALADDTPKTRLKALQKAGIFPKLTGEVFRADKALGVEYQGGLQVTMGNFLTPAQTAKSPHIRFQGDPDSTYTLMLIDPDAPTIADPKWGPWRHWIVVNIPGERQSSNSAQSTQLTSYVGPAPPPKTGDHRYIFLLYKQPSFNKNYPPLSETFDDRRNFNFTDYAIKTGLKLHAVNFFYSKNAQS
ncbi:hypothetical protein [Absidia glauca]|uniref:Phosphatidylethanolamine-binding protein n=1 Tax=Absidia glauca TaxID=4829 RepID=A0A168Q402_ABSGL|nr:hypothetical protein [Absidia glauca]